MTNFLNAFWPNLAATVIGVALGLPVALYLNRQLTKQMRAHEAAEKKRLLSDAISTLIESCGYNIRVLNNISDLARDGDVMRNPDLRTTTWDTLSGLLVSHLNNPDLLQVASHHWLRLKRLENLNNHAFAMHTGQVPLPQPPVTLGSYIFELHRSASDLARHASDMSERFQQAQGQAAPNNSFKPPRLRGAA